MARLPLPDHVPEALPTEPGERQGAARGAGVAGRFLSCPGDRPTIGLATVLIEEGLVTPRVPGFQSLETPAGRVDVQLAM